MNFFESCSDRFKKSKLVTFLNEAEKPRRFDWILAVTVILFCYLSFNHGDVTATATHGKDLLQCIFKGKFFKFYDYTESTAVYQITIYLLFAIWSVPPVIIYKIAGIPLWGVTEYAGVNYPLLMWYKLLPTLFYIGIAVILYKIALEIKMGKNAAKWTSFLWISSPIAVFSQFVFGQYDSLGLFFMVLALYMFLKKRYYWFAGIIAVAMTFKLFALFIFIPMILLVEKRIFHVVKYMIIGVSGWLICNLLFLRSAGFRKIQEFSNGMIDRFSSIGISSGMGTIALFLGGLMVICVIAYNKKSENAFESNKYANYIPFFVFGMFFCFILWHPQWVIILIPFLVITTMQNTRIITSIILEIAMGIGYIGTTVICFTYNVDSNLINFGIFKEIFGSRDVFMLGPLFTLNNRLNVVMYITLFTVSILILLFYRFPAKKNLVESETAIKENTNAMAPRGYIIIRTLTVLLYALPTIYRFFKAG